MRDWPKCFLGTFEISHSMGSTGRKTEFGENQRKITHPDSNSGSREQHNPCSIQKRREPGMCGQRSPRIRHSVARCFTVILKDSFAGYKRFLIDRFFFSFCSLNIPFTPFTVSVAFLLHMGHTCQRLCVTCNFVLKTRHFK